MPGYQLVDHHNLAPFRDKGITPHDNPIGLLDFLRELAADELPFARFQELRVMGLEDVLIAAMPADRELALDIRNRLRAAASELERRLVSVQVVFKGRLRRGEELWSEYPDRRLPVGVIFGSPPPNTDSRGNQYYSANFNLTSG
jgi:hypothetical protein